LRIEILIPLSDTETGAPSIGFETVAEHHRRDGEAQRPGRRRRSCRLRVTVAPGPPRLSRAGGPDTTDGPHEDAGVAQPRSSR
jgi:hypothetical protein